MRCAVEAPSHPPATFKRFESPRRISKRTLQLNATTNTISSGSSSTSSSQAVAIITPTISHSTPPTTPQPTQKPPGPEGLSTSMSKQKKTRRSRRRKKGHETSTTTSSISTVLAVADPPRRDLRRHKRPHDGSVHHDKRDKKMRWEECNRYEVSRLHRNCMQKGQPLAPYNTTQFIMNEHNAEKEIDFDQLSGQIQQMHNNRHRPHNSTNGSGNGSTAQDGSTSASGRLDDSNREDYYYSSPEDESYFLEQQFQHDYNTMHAERLNSMSKSELLKEYLIIEKELELMRQKSPSGSSAAAGPSSSRGDASLTVNFTTSITKSPRPPSMPSSPRGQYLNAFAQQQQQQHQSSSRNQHNHHHHSHHHHSSNGNSSSHNRCLKENKRLRKLLKQVYSRYNSLMYCINYVNSTNNSGSTTTSGEASAFQVDDSAVGDSNSVQHNHQSNSNHLPPPSLTPDDYQMTNEMHYRIEKYITHPSPSPLTSFTSRGGSSSSASYTSSSSTSSTSSSATSVISEEDGAANGNSTASTPTIQELSHPQRAKRSSSGGSRSTSTTPTTTPIRPAGNSGEKQQQQQQHYEAAECGSSTEREAREVLHKLVDLVVDDDDDVEGN